MLVAHAVYLCEAFVATARYDRLVGHLENRKLSLRWFFETGMGIRR